MFAPEFFDPHSQFNAYRAGYRIEDIVRDFWTARICDIASRREVPPVDRSALPGQNGPTIAIKGGEFGGSRRSADRNLTMGMAGKTTPSLLIFEFEGLEAKLRDGIPSSKIFAAWENHRDASHEPQGSRLKSVVVRADLSPLDAISRECRILIIARATLQEWRNIPELKERGSETLVDGELLGMIIGDSLEAVPRSAYRLAQTPTVLAETDETGFLNVFIPIPRSRRSTFPRRSNEVDAELLHDLVFVLVLAPSLESEDPDVVLQRAFNRFPQNSDS